MERHFVKIKNVGKAFWEDKICWKSILRKQNVGETFWEDKKCQKGKLRWQKKTSERHFKKTRKVWMAYKKPKNVSMSKKKKKKRCIQGKGVAHRWNPVKQKMISREMSKGHVFRRKRECFHIVTVAVYTHVWGV